MRRLVAVALTAVLVAPSVSFGAGAGTEAVRGGLNLSLLNSDGSPSLFQRSVRVTGPAGFDQTFSAGWAGKVLMGLVPGTYRVYVAGSGVLKTVAVAAGAPTKLTVDLGVKDPRLSRAAVGSALAPEQLTPAQLVQQAIANAGGNAAQIAQNISQLIASQGASGGAAAAQAVVQAAMAQGAAAGGAVATAIGQGIGAAAAAASAAGQAGLATAITTAAGNAATALGSAAASAMASTVTSVASSSVVAAAASTAAAAVGATAASVAAAAVDAAVNNNVSPSK